MPQCSSCSEFLEDGEVFCSNCGKKHVTPAPLPEVFEAEDVVAPQAMPQVTALPPVDSDLNDFALSWDQGRCSMLVDGFVNPFHLQVTAHKQATNIQMAIQLYDGDTYWQQIATMRSGRSRKATITIPDNRLKPAHGMQCDLFFSYVDEQTGAWHGFQSQDISVDVVSVTVSDNININVGDINIGSGNTTDRAADSTTNIQIENMDLLGALEDKTSPNALIEKLRSQGSDWRALAFFEISEEEFPQQGKPQSFARVTTPLKRLTLQRNGRLLHLLAGDTWSFGRATSNDICLRKQDPGMGKDEFIRINRRFSSTHFTIMDINGELSLVDGGFQDGVIKPSTNGIQMEGFNVDTAALGKQGKIVVAPASNPDDELHLFYQRVAQDAYLLERKDVAQPEQFLIFTQEVDLSHVEGFTDLPITLKVVEKGVIISKSGQPLTALDSLSTNGLVATEYKQA